MEKSSEDNSEEILDFSKIPIKALNVSSRLKLSELLTPIMMLVTSDGVTRDYRGLLQLMGFSHTYIQTLSERSSDPIRDALNIWGTSAAANVDILLKMLLQMERLDVIDDIKPFFEKDAQVYLQRRNDLPLQVFKGPQPPAEINADLKLSTFKNIEDSEVDEFLQQFNAYVCYCDEDLPFVIYFVQILEQFGIKIFLRERDEPPGRYNLDILMTFLTKKCARVLLLLSPEFLKSPQSQKQLQLISGMAAEEKEKMLIPIIHKACEIPSYIKLITKIDLSKKEKQVDTRIWAWKRLAKFLGVDISNSTFCSFPDADINSSLSFQPSLSIHTISSLQSLPSPCSSNLPQIKQQNTELSNVSIINANQQCQNEGHLIDHQSNNSKNEVSSNFNHINQHGASQMHSLKINQVNQPPNNSRKFKKGFSKKVSSFLGHIIPSYSKSSPSISDSQACSSKTLDDKAQATK